MQAIRPCYYDFFVFTVTSVYAIRELVAINVFKKFVFYG